MASLRRNVFLFIILPALCTSELQDFKHPLFGNLFSGNNQTFTDRVKEQGYWYDVKKYTVTTDDGYILNLFNVQSNGCGSFGDTPVLLMHGFLLSADVWLDPGPEASLLYLLTDACYSVWAGNVRGNNYGRRHETLNPDKDAKFWDFAVDEMGIYDAPAIIDGVLNNSGANQFSYVGFSQGGGMFGIMGSEKPEYLSKVKTFVGLAPAMRLRNTKSFVFRQFSWLLDMFSPLLSLLGTYEVLAKGSAIQFLLNNICQYETSNANVFCNSLLELVDSQHKGSIAPETMSVIFNSFPAGTSVKNFKRYAQSFNTDKFQKFDYGRVKNFEVYGSATPPEFDLSQITIPVLLIPGLNDKVVDLADVSWLQEQLPNATLKIVDDDLWNHFDVTYSQLTPDLLVPLTVNHLKEYTSF